MVSVVTAEVSVIPPEPGFTISEAQLSIFGLYTPALCRISLCAAAILTTCPVAPLPCFWSYVFSIFCLAKVKL